MHCYFAKCTGNFLPQAALPVGIFAPRSKFPKQIFTLFVQGSFLCPDQVYARNISSQRQLCPRGSGCSISQRLLCPYRPNVNKYHVQYNCTRLWCFQRKGDKKEKRKNRNKIPAHCDWRCITYVRPFTSQTTFPPPSTNYIYTYYFYSAFVVTLLM